MQQHAFAEIRQQAGLGNLSFYVNVVKTMKMMETYSERWMRSLERKQVTVPYSFVWALLGLGVALFVFGFVDRTWGYYLEGFFAVGAAVVLFVIEAAWRRIAELKRYLAEYVESERASAMEGGSIESVPTLVEE